MHPDVLSGGVAEFDAAVEARVCPHLNEIGEVALGEMRSVYEQLDAGDYSALGRLAERLANAVEQKVPAPEPKTPVQKQPDVVKAEAEPVLDKAAQETKAEQIIATADVEPALAVSRHEMAEKNVAQRSDVSPPVAHAPVKEPVALVREPNGARAVMEQIAAQTVQTAQLEVEQAYTAVTEVVIGPNADRLAPVQDTAAIEAVHDRMRFSERVEAVLGSTTPTDYEPSFDLGAAIEAERTVMLDALPPEQLPFSDPIDTAEAFADEELTLLPYVTEPSLESNGITELVSAVVAKPEQSETLVQTAWDDVLEKEPLELYDDFTEAVQLQSLIMPPEEVPLTFHETTDTDEPVVLVDAIQKSRPSPAIALTVAERLAELDIEEKETVAPALKEIVETVRVFDLLAVADAEPEVIETAQAELEELVTVLFEQLGIAHEPENIKRFVAILLRPDFQPAQAEELATVDLEHEGTREAKLHFAQFVSGGLSDVEEVAERVLGKLVVFYAAHHTSPEYELAAA